MDVLSDNKDMVEGDPSQDASDTIKTVPPSTADDGSKIKIRFGTAQDKEPARALLRQFHANTIFGHLQFSDRKFDQHAEKILSKPPHMACLVAEFRGELVGLIWGTAGSYTLSDEGVMTTVHIVAVDVEKLGPVRRVKAFRGLLEGVKSWSKMRGAEHVLVHGTMGMNVKIPDRLMRSVGGRVIGAGYVV